MLVIDASAAVQASLSPDGSAVRRTEELVAPGLLWSAGLSVLHELGWRGTIAGDARGRFVSAPIAARRPPRLAEEAWRVADELGRPQRRASSIAAIVGPTDL